MASVIVCGGGVIGLSTALMLARDGHEVTVLEADAHGPPATPVQAWEAWDRKGVAQFRQPHNLFARFRQVCDEELPGLTDRLQTAGLVWTDPLAVLPPGITDRDPRAGDEDFRFVTGRRPVTESVFAARGAGAAALGGTPRRARDRADQRPLGSFRPAARGRGAHVGWRGLARRPCRRRDGPAFAGVGAADPARAPRRRTEQAEDSGFAYYTRYFTGPGLPSLIGPPLMPIGTISVLTLPGDNGTWSVTVFGASGDAPLEATARC